MLNPPLTTPTVSIIVDTFFRPAMLRHAVGSLLAQTWKHVEVVIVDNGSTPETKPVIAELTARSPAVKVVAFTENQHSFEDPRILYRIAYNAGLRASTGDLVFHMNDDDWMAPDFCERIARLFVDNPACTTAIGLPVPVRPDGSEIDLRQQNQRPRYMPGQELALAVLDGRPGWANPGHGFVMRREALEAAGGFHEYYEQHLMHGVVAFGVTGFDPEARMYWRYHDSQLNKLWTQHGLVGLPFLQGMLADCRIEERWTAAFGAETARKVVRTLERKACASAAWALVDNLADFRFAAVRRILGWVGLNPRVWAEVPAKVWQKRRWFAASLLRAAGLRKPT